MASARPFPTHEFRARRVQAPSPPRRKPPTYGRSSPGGTRGPCWGCGQKGIGCTSVRGDEGHVPSRDRHQTLSSPVARVAGNMVTSPSLAPGRRTSRRRETRGRWQEGPQASLCPEGPLRFKLPSRLSRGSSGARNCRWATLPVDCRYRRRENIRASGTCGRTLPA
ncbi:hypothetical protein GWK47_008037 [Chionoecetes opilio]|uniref:Uncharacterized protein n=1 Tax=Chionoecetes opilio TaxID=41210 RepID=A0A8J4Y095_CHIOP|nr:hypothetical protein GWK47_008037 [Chionoecetes opilio]